MSTPKPRDRDAAEDRPTNLARYVLGGFGENATATLGIDVKYPTSFVQGVTVLDFQEGSTAEAAGIEQFDIILEVDSIAVGLIRHRFYEPWQHYGRSGTQKVEVLNSFLNQDGERKYYYRISLTGIQEVETYRSLPDDFFVTGKPHNRALAEDRDRNVTASVRLRGRQLQKYRNSRSASAFSIPWTLARRSSLSSPRQSGGQGAPASGRFDPRSRRGADRPIRRSPLRTVAPVCLLQDRPSRAARLLRRRRRRLPVLLSPRAAGRSRQFKLIATPRPFWSPP